MEKKVFNLKKYVYGLMNKDNIKELVLNMSKKYDLTDKIKDVELTFEEFNGVSHEDPINYDQFDKILSINVPVIHSKFVQLYDKDAYVYNWMILINEIFYALEDIKLNSLIEEKVKCSETRIINLYNDFLYGEDRIQDYPFLYNYKKDDITDANELINPIERIKSVNAYFNTLEMANKYHIKSKAIECFRNNFIDKLLNGYNEENSSEYPLKTLFFQKSYIEGRYFMSQFPWYDKEVMMALSNATDEVNDVRKRLALGYPIESCEQTQVRTYKI